MQTNNNTEANREPFINEEMEKELMDEFLASEIADSKKERKIIADFKKQLKGLINVTGLFRWFDENQDHWEPKEIVEVVLTDEKSNGYSQYQHARIVDDKDKLLYVKTEMDEYVRGVKYYYVWQTNNGYIEDSYSGCLLFELKNGKFFKISYSC